MTMLLVGKRNLMMLCRFSNTMFVSMVASRTKATSYNRRPVIGSLFQRKEKYKSIPMLHRCVHNQEDTNKTPQSIETDPYILLKDDLEYIYEDIRQELNRATTHIELNKMATYYFDGQGKAFRPMVTILMAKALNYHIGNENKNISNAQRQIAMVSEMIHTASLVHDDVIDQSFARRGKPSVNVLWNHKQLALVGDFIIAVTSMLLARLKQRASWAGNVKRQVRTRSHKKCRKSSVNSDYTIQN